MRRSRRGIALILVLTVILALAIIATPFVLSMLRQERTAVGEKVEQQSTWGAEGAKNWAIVRLYDGLEANERKPNNPLPLRSPYWDHPNEFRVELNDDRLSPLNVRDPQGSLWGLSVQDEQGKLNVTSCPEPAVDRLRSILDGRIDDAKDCLTSYSHRDARWIFPQRVRRIGNFGGGIWGLAADSMTFAGPGARIRYVNGQGGEIIARVTAHHGAAVETDPRLPADFDGVGTVEVEARHPVNICTAPRAVLIAMWEGLTIDATAPIDVVTRQEAELLADALQGKPYESVEDFLFNDRGIPCLWKVTGLSEGNLTAVTLNAICPTYSALQGTGTVPLCTANAGTVTILGRAMVNAPAGTALSRTGFREIVDLGPPAPVLKIISSERDFDHSMLRRSAMQGGIAVPIVGFPFGSGYVSSPTPGFATATQGWAKPNDAWIRQASARDERGASAYQGAVRAREHFNDTMDGLELKGLPRSYPWDDVLTTNPTPPDPNPAVNSPDVAAGGFEMWFRFDQAPQGVVPILDLREQDSVNRLSLRWENNVLILTATDTSEEHPAIALTKGLAEIRQNFPVAPVGTWFHVGAYWKGTRFGHLALLVDGYADPAARMKHVDLAGADTITELTAALPVPSPLPTPPPSPLPPPQTLGLANPAWIPAPTTAEPWLTPLLIGAEVVHYDASTQFVYRGFRNTTIADHPVDAKVTLFGYTSKLATQTVDVDLGAPHGAVSMNFDRLPLTTATVSFDFGANPFGTLAGAIAAADVTLTVNSATITDFPQSGYLKIEDEIVYYTSYTAAGVFSGVTRGEHGTSAVGHGQNMPVEMWGIPVSNTGGFANPTIIQVENEWIGPIYVDPNRPFFIPKVTGGIPFSLNPCRGIMVGGRGNHAAGVAVVPVFAAREADLLSNRHNLFPGDRITVADAANNRERHQVRNVWHPQTPNLSPWAIGTVNVQLAALFSPAFRDFIPDGNLVRCVKWPSGELPSLGWLQTSNPSFTIGPAAITIDEVKFFAVPKGPFWVATTVDGSGVTIDVNSAQSLARYGGAVKIGDEIIGYAERNGGQLTGVQRGWLNSSAHTHDAGDLVFNLPFIPVTSLQDDLSGGRDIKIRQMPSGACPRGYVRIGQEILGFEWNEPQESALKMVQGRTPDTGMRYARFGTNATGHAAGALVYVIPYRFEDGYEPTMKVWDNRLPYYQASWTERGGRWRSLYWEEEIPENDSNLVIRCFARADGCGELSLAGPGPAGDAIRWELAGGGRPHALNHAGMRRDAGQLDARFVVEYRPNSYWPQHSWKRAPKIHRIEAEVERDTKVLFHEDE